MIWLSGSIDRERLRLIGMILGGVQYCLAILYDENPDESVFCNVEYTDKDDKRNDILDCHANTLGSMIRFFAGKKFWPLPEPSDLVETSIHDLETMLSCLEDVCESTKPDDLFRKDHRSCTVAFEQIDLREVSRRSRKGRQGASAPFDGAYGHERRFPPVWVWYEYFLSSRERDFVSNRARLLGTGESGCADEPS